MTTESEPLSMERRIHLIDQVTRRVLVMTAAALGVFALLFGLTFFLQQRLLITWVAFVCGIVGGFVSIQQRLRRLPDEELLLLCSSWFQVFLVPFFGGIFALVLYCLFLSGLVESALFPSFWFPPAPDSVTHAYIVQVLTETYPATGPDFAKLVFWCFVAGFSERFVPHLISSLTARVDGGTRRLPPPQPPPQQPPPEQGDRDD